MAGVLHATPRTERNFPQNSTSKPRTLEVRQRICENSLKNAKGKKPEKERIRQNPLADLEHWTLAPAKLIFLS